MKITKHNRREIETATEIYFIMKKRLFLPVLFANDIWNKLNKENESVAGLAKRLNINPSTMYRYVNQTDVPSLENYIRVCAWLDVSLDRFVRNVK